MDRDLADGRVLMSGGQPRSGELYDPATGTWTATAAMTESYTDLLVSVRLPDGTVLLIGGGSVRAPGSAVAQVYDPTTDSWSAAGTLTRARLVQSASLLPDGRVLVVGSSGSGSNGTRTAELYDPGGGS